MNEDAAEALYYGDTDRHEDPPVRVSDEPRIELATEKILDRWQDDKEPFLTEELDLEELIKGIAFRNGQDLLDGVHALEMALTAEAKRLAGKQTYLPE